jgi:hypothetical protein
MRRLKNPSPDPKLPDAPTGVDPQASAELVPAGETPHVAPAGALTDTAALLDVIARAARDPDVNVEKMRELFALKERIEAGAAKRAFYAALARAKGEFGPILKTRQVDYPHKDGQGRTNYKYEELADVGQVVDPVLSKHGLSYRHKSTQEANGKIRVTCILSHEDGYSEENSLEGLEDKSGQKNPNQAIASTVTYLQRYTLKEALGIGAGRDNDDRGPPPDELIDPDDVLYVEDLLRETNSDLAKFLETIGSPSVTEMRASQFKRAIALLNEKKRRAAAPQ